jgi:hypothetical protein
MLRIVLLLICGVLVLSVLAGCGGSDAPQVLHNAGPNFDQAAGAAAAERELEAWALAAKRAADDAEFRLKPPPPRVQLQEANSRGWQLGVESHDASRVLREIGDLRSTDEAEFTCQVFDYYLQYPNELGSEEAFANYLYENLVHRQLPSLPWEQFTGAASRFRSAIPVAANAPETVANTALATFCSYPG